MGEEGVMLLSRFNLLFPVPCSLSLLAWTWFFKGLICGSACLRYDMYVWGLGAHIIRGFYMISSEPQRACTQR